MEECGRGAAVEQLTARGMLSIPAMGAIGILYARSAAKLVSIPAMGGNSQKVLHQNMIWNINPRDGGQ